jgi:hypothetical protein
MSFSLAATAMPRSFQMLIVEKIMEPFALDSRTAAVSVANRVTSPSFSASTEQTTPHLTEEKRSELGTHYATSIFLS